MKVVLHINGRAVMVGDWIANGDGDIWLRCEEFGRYGCQFVNIQTGEFETPSGDLRFADRDDLL